MVFIQHGISELCRRMLIKYQIVVGTFSTTTLVAVFLVITSSMGANRHTSVEWHTSFSIKKHHSGFVIPAFFFRKKGYINFVPKVGPSVWVLGNISCDLDLWVKVK